LKYHQVLERFSTISTQGGMIMSSRVTSSTATPMGQNTMGPMVPHEKIAMRAYEKWCQRGCPDGTHMQDWMEAEKELRAEMGRTGQSTQARR
jgi:hypothetical protein